MNPPDGIASRLVLGPALRAQSDRRLVRLVRDGYETAFEEIVRRYGKALGGYAASIVGNRSEDVTQDAFSKALLALRRSDAEIELRPWLFRIVRNTALNDLRDSPPSPEMLAEAIAAGGSPAQELEQREELADLIGRLKALPEPQRAAIVMRELEGLSHDEIAAALGLSGGGARQAIYRARQALRDGAGMLVPLPLLRTLLASPGTAEVAEAGAIGITGAAGTGMALKATAATVLVAGAVGAGVTLKPHDQSRNATPTPVQASQGSAGGEATSQLATGEDSGSGHGGGQDDGSNRGHGHDGRGDDRSGHGESEPLDDHGHGLEPGDNHGGRSGPSGPGGSGTGGGSSGSGSGDDRSGTSLGSDDSDSGGSSGSSDGGPGPSSGSGASGSDSGSSSGDSSVSGGSLSSGSGSDELFADSDSSGSGSSDLGTVPEPDDDHSGPG